MKKRFWTETPSLVASAKARGLRQSPTSRICKSCQDPTKTVFSAIVANALQALDSPIQIWGQIPKHLRPCQMQERGPGNRELQSAGVEDLRNRLGGVSCVLSAGGGSSNSSSRSSRSSSSSSSSCCCCSSSTSSSSSSSSSSTTTTTTTSSMSSSSSSMSSSMSSSSSSSSSSMSSSNSSSSSSSRRSSMP